MKDDNNMNTQQNAPDPKPLTGFRWFWKKYLRRYLIWITLILGMLFLMYVGAYGGYKTIPADRKKEMYTSMGIIVGLWILADVSRAIIIKKMKFDNNKKIDNENSNVKHVRITADDISKKK